VKENCGHPAGSVSRLRAVHTSWNSCAQPTATTCERPAAAAAVGQEQHVLADSTVSAPDDSTALKARRESWKRGRGGDSVS